ncbi:vWFA domain-containing protein [Yasminevirus sp. GU-2018]|uniref:RBR-type E3 ubiquitin transferase n=1 Tax=Yasminevirus sp. GU-2018 TaxID=2420051 RepID=A0A5K0U8U4_9VIRU|nr:vWFA domain-containing protein [Yasminevirus sp. GU-2018]
MTSKISSKSTKSNGEFSALILADNTGSMGQACTSARTSFHEVRAQLNLLNGRDCVEVAVIGDYDRSTPNNHQGGWALLPKTSSAKEVDTFLSTYVQTHGGGGTPEAYKTAFNFIVKMEERPDTVFMFCDAMPHGTIEKMDNEGYAEKKFIEANSMIWDWDTLCATVKSLGIRVVTFLTRSNLLINDVWRKMGDVILMNVNESSAITKAMLWTFNALTGQIQTDLSPREFKCDSPIAPIIKIDLSATLKSADPEAVLSAFEALLDVKVPERAMCLTTNDVLGKYWRQICGKIKYIDDRKYEPRCQKVMDTLSACKEKLGASDKAKLKEWIDRSHNETPQIRELIQKSIVAGAKNFLVLPADLASTLTLDDVLELGRGGGFAEVAKLISSLELQTSDDQKFALPEAEDEAPVFVPLFGSKGTVLSLIANLLSPGLMFSRAEGFMVAILALTNKYLAELALSYLTEHKGKWIKWDLDAEGKQLFPVFWSLNFMRLLKLAPNSVLTEAEITFRDHYLRVSKVVRNHDATVQIIIPLIFSGLRPYTTWKRHCSGCGQERCFTLFPGKSKVCALCINASLTEDSHYANPSKIVEKESTKSNWAQCSSCTGNYCVICPERLNVRPKCHNCREHDAPELVECCACLNKFVNPSGSAQIAMRDALALLSESKDDKSVLRAEVIRAVESRGEFICPRCVDVPSDMTSKIDVKISVLIAENDSLIKLIPVGPYKSLMAKDTSLWKRVTICKEQDKKDVIEPSDIKRLTYNGFSIHKPSEVATAVKTTLLDHTGFETCQMCVSDVPVRNMVPACGNCPNRVCESCVKGWYSQVEIGHLVSQGHCACPFCKGAPVFKTVRGLDIRHIRNLRPTKQNKGQVCDWDHRSVYGVCRDCLCLKVALTRECARGDLPDVKNFVCDDCRAVRESRETARAGSLLAEAKSEDSLNTKLCPNCQAKTERTGGCHHITCVCGAHWCWVCNSASFEDGTLFDEHTVYDHMAECGGIFPGDLRE